MEYLRDTNMERDYVMNSREIKLVSSKQIGIVIIIIIGFVIGTFAYLKVGTQNESTLDTECKSNIPYIHECTLHAGVWPNGLLVDNRGIVWVTSSKTNTLFGLDPKSGKIKNYEIKEENSELTRSDRNSTMVWTMVQDGDGFIWFSQLGTKSIWRFDPIKETFRLFQSDTGSPFQMKIDKNTGKIWFTTLTGNTLGVIEKTKSNSEYDISAFNLGNNTTPAGLFLQDKSVWVTEISNQKVIQYEINREAGLVKNITKVSEIPNNKTSLSSPTDLYVIGNTLWLTEHGTSFLTKYVTDTNEMVRFPTSQNTFHVTTLPFWIRVVNNGTGIWFNEHTGNKIAYFDTVNMTLTEYDVPSRPKDGYLTYPLNISVDPHDYKILWFSEWNTDKVGFVDGHVHIPFGIHADTDRILLNNTTNEQAVNLEVTGQSPWNANRVFLGASSSMTPTAAFDNLDLQFSPSVLDLSSAHTSQLFLKNKSAPSGNYTLGISASDGFATKTIFLNLTIPKR